MRKDGRRRQTQRSGDRVRLHPAKVAWKTAHAMSWFARGSRVRPMDGGYLGRKGGGVFPRPPAPRCRPGRVFQANGKIIIIVMARGTRGIEPRNTRKKQNHEGARKNLRTTNGQEWARIKFSKPRNTRNTREKTEPRRGTEKPKNHEWTRMGTNNIFKTTKHTEHTGKNRTTKGHGKT